MEFTCPACGSRHIRREHLVDEYIHCNCGLDLYVFYNEGMTFTIPAKEMTRESFRQSFRRLVIDTGRCPGAHVEPVAVNYMEMLRRIDSLVLMEISLEKYQEETIGKQVLHCGDIETILEIINEPGKDALVKGTEEGAVVKEQKTRVPKKQKQDYIRLVEDGLAALSNGQMTYLEDRPLKQWQVDIMKQDAARTGLLFGDAG